jgi:hypothetical protein
MPEHERGGEDLETRDRRDECLPGIPGSNGGGPYCVIAASADELPLC